MDTKCYCSIKVNVLSAQAISEFLISTVPFWFNCQCNLIWDRNMNLFILLCVCQTKIVCCRHSRLKGVDFRLIQETVQHLLDVSKGVLAQVVDLPGLPAPTMLQLVDLFICNPLLQRRQPASKEFVHRKGYIPERCDALQLLLWGPQCPHAQCRPPRPPAPGHHPQIVPPVRHMLPQSSMLSH